MEQTYQDTRADAGVRHDASALLLDYWNRRRGRRSAPQRSDIRPGDIRMILPGIFILEHGGDRLPVFRLAGTAICDLFSRELKGVAFYDLWLPGHTEQAIKMAETISHDEQPCVGELLGESRAGRPLALEMMLLPLAGGDRLIGSLNALERPYWMNTDPLVGCLTTSVRRLDPPEYAGQSVPPPSRKQAQTSVYRSSAPGVSKRAPHLTVLDGGLD